MAQNITLCSRSGGVPKCKHCNDQNCIKNGKTSNGKQRYQCSKCGKKFITEYTYQAYNPNINHQIITLTKEGLGIRSTAKGIAYLNNHIVKTHHRHRSKYPATHYNERQSI